jgi:lipopolysaccharide biosynthesis protein
VQASPLFDGHYQPRMPADLGFYDLSFVEVMVEQVELAQRFSVDAFNFYFYWFDGKPLLRKPLANFLESKIDFEFCLTWANEDWKRGWHGGNQDILIRQNYSSGFEESLFADLLPYLSDSRYLRLDGMPVLNVYHLQDIPNSQYFVEKLKDMAQKAGLPGLHVVAVASYGLNDPKLVGADALMEFPPHGISPDCLAKEKPGGLSPTFSGQIFDYTSVVLESYQNPPSTNPTYRGLFPDWDNTARKAGQSHIVLGSSPEKFRLWLDTLLEWATNNESPFIFINAWNEWPEGAHLEPDLKFGTSYLSQIRAATADAQAGKFKTLSQVLELLGVGPEHATDKNSPVSRWQRTPPRLLRWANVGTAIRLIRSDPSLKSLFSRVFQSLRARFKVRKKSTSPVKTREFKSTGKKKFDSLSISVIYHIYFPEYLDAAFASMNHFPKNTQFFVTSSSTEILESVKWFSVRTGTSITATLTPNLGRNFGPMLVSLREAIKSSDVIFHLHSKKSVHERAKSGARWGMSLWDTLVGSQTRVESILRSFANNQDIGLAYTTNELFFGPESLIWAGNMGAGRKWLETNGFEWPGEHVAFPAGGMFAARTAAIKEILDYDWNFDQFPPENGQVDGQLHHAIERLIGAVPHLKGYSHLTLHPEDSEFGIIIEPKEPSA